jgi:hypothetical protein
MKYAARPRAVSRVVCRGFAHRRCDAHVGKTPWTGPGRRCCTVGVLHPTPDRFRGLARSSPWRWRALAFDVHRRPLHGPEHTVLATVERGVGLEVRLADGERHRDAAMRSPAVWFECGTEQGIRGLPFAWELPVEVDADGFVVHRTVRTSDDPMWQDYQWVAMLDPVELADGVPRHPGAGSGPEVAPPPALVVHRLDAAVRHGRETWWAEVSPREGYTPRCSCCPLLFGRVSEAHDRDGGGPTMRARPVGFAYATSYLVALDVETGVCMHVEHLGGDHAGRGFSVDIRSVVTAG